MTEPPDTITLPAAEVRIVQRRLRHASAIMDAWPGENWMRGMGRLWEHVSEANNVARRWADEDETGEESDLTSG